MAQADEAGLELYLDATTPGYPLYERNGFNLATTQELDLRPFGGDSIYTMKSMIRPAFY